MTSGAADKPPPLAPRALLSASGRLLGQHYSAFLPGALACCLLLAAGGRALLLLPFAYSASVFVAAEVLGLTRRHGAAGWFVGAPYYWLLHLLLYFVLLVLVPLLPAGLIAAVSAQDTTPDDALLSAAVAFAALIDGYLLYRLWPVMAASYLLGATEHFENPLMRLWFLRFEQPTRVGPGLGRAWAWTGLAPQHSLPALPVLCVPFLAVYFCASTEGLLSLLTACVTAFVLIPLAALLLTAMCWQLLRSVGEDLLVRRGMRLEGARGEPEPDFVNRSPGELDDYRLFHLPLQQHPEMIARCRSDLAEAGAVQALRGEEGFLCVWESRTAMRNEERPDLYVDFQGFYLAVWELRPDSGVVERFHRLLENWRMAYPIEEL